MRIVSEDSYRTALRSALIEANFQLRPDVVEYFKRLRAEVTESRRGQVDIFIRNAEISASEKRSLCQDTGYVQLFIEWGNRAGIDFDLPEVTDSVIAAVYTEFKLRFSIADPITRRNTGNNAPAFINIKSRSGDNIKVTVLLKGGGSENVTRAGTLLPTSTEDDLVEWVTESVRLAGSKACPPYLLGVGIGGNLEKAVGLSKKALLRSIGEKHSDASVQALSDRILERVNGLPIGFQGLDFGETVMSVFVETLPCHIATLPIAVSFGCHSVRQSEFVL